MANILIVRFSALGDIAMTIPVISEFAKQYPEHSITVLSRNFAEPLFRGVGQNVSFKGVNLKDPNYKGIPGIYRLYKELKSGNYDYVADFHDVLRTKILRTFFRLSGAKVSSINKERSKRKAFIKTKDKNIRLTTSFEKYTAALNSLGFSFPNNFISIFKDRPINGVDAIDKVGGKNFVGIAPFTTHRGKEYPIQLMEQVVERTSLLPETTILLFGAGEREKKVLEEWEAKYRNVISLAGKFDMQKELSIMSGLKVMVSMDSANMHLASLTSTPVISIWGATSPECGFMGWKQRIENTVQKDLTCRPCSIFGNKECKFGDYRCMNLIKPEEIVDKIKSFL